jgi:hypothetical protein
MKEMARQNVAILKKSDEQDSNETPDGKTSLVAPLAGAGDGGGVPETRNAPGDPAPVRLVSENDEAGVSLAPEALRRLVAAEEERREIIREFIARNLKSGTDYGTVQSGGRESKPSLFKPGAEKICLLFQLRPRFVGDRATLAMAGGRPGVFAYICRLIDPTGRVVGEGRGAAELTERDGWTVNNAIKIAEKRAQVDAVLRVAGLSEIFTQDLEDMSQRQALEHETGAHAPYTSRSESEPARPTANGADNRRPTYIAEAPPAAPVEPAPERSAERPAAPAAEGEDLCTEQQERTIRALLPRAGISEAELTSSMRVNAIAELTRARATKVIDRLNTKARERGQQS